FDEMARGEFLPAAAAHAARLVKDLAMRGAQAVVLGCTELPILLRDVATPCRTLDTARLHALAAADFSLQLTPSLPSLSTSLMWVLPQQPRMRASPRFSVSA